jgi:integrase
MKGVKRYLHDRFGTIPLPFSPNLGTENILEPYKSDITSSCSKMWSTNSLAILRRLEDSTGALTNISQSHAKAFLNTMAITRSKATRNRALASCNRFFNWAVRTRRIANNPFKDIPFLTEEHPESITYCTKEERERILAAAKEIPLPYMIAVPIAFYTGCRREEIARMQWKHILFRESRIVIPKTKTSKRRVLPLADNLRPVLESVERHDDFVVRYARTNETTWTASACYLIESIRRKLCRPLKCGKDGKPVGTIHKQYAMTEDDLRKHPPQYCPELAADGQPWLPAERVGWTTWRHTFGSLLAQAGVSIDKISAWMGNTPDVCRRHYAEFTPRNSFDEEINKL